MNSNNDFKKGTVTRAEELYNFYIARNVLILIVYQIDIQTAFSEQSLIYQQNDQSSKFILTLRH